jgi:4-diphosphocytidyl-2-C-methyl-D-erythritol kinase
MTAALPEFSETVVVRAPGKVNLALCVGGLDEHGYHDLATVFQAVSLFDDITVSPNPGGGIELTISGEGADVVPTDHTNIAWRAAELLARHLGTVADVSIHIAKGIPVAGGMAGGSADAAGTLVACDALWESHVPREVLYQLASELGADVPFSLHGGTALGLGRGDQLTSVLVRGGFHWVFALAMGGLSTPSVYSKLDELRGDRAIPEPRVPDAVLTALSSGDTTALASALLNDLQAPAVALRADLQRVLNAGLEAGALAGLVSGSGPTCAFLARDHAHAVDIAVNLSSAGVCRTVKTAEGPTQGARVISPGT